jgi:hypothetical protein
MDIPNDVGRPEITDDEKKEMVHKLEPYLKAGLSIRKALKEAQIPRSTFYKVMDRDDGFRDQIDRFRQFLSIMLNNSIVRHLQVVVNKQNPKEGETKVPLSKEDVAFLQWFATNSNHTREEFGERKDIGLYDPEAEVQRLNRLIDEESEDEPDVDTSQKE